MRVTIKVDRSPEAEVDLALEAIMRLCYIIVGLMFAHLLTFIQP